MTGDHLAFLPLICCGWMQQGGTTLEAERKPLPDAESADSRSWAYPIFPFLCEKEISVTYKLPSLWSFVMVAQMN